MLDKNGNVVAESRVVAMKIVATTAMGITMARDSVSEVLSEEEARRIAEDTVDVLFDQITAWLDKYYIITKKGLN